MRTEAAGDARKIEIPVTHTNAIDKSSYGDPRHLESCWSVLSGSGSGLITAIVPAVWSRFFQSWRRILSTLTETQEGSADADGEVTSTVKKGMAVAVVVVVLVAGGLVFMALRPANAWSSAFCHPIDRVVGVEVLQVTEGPPGTSSGNGTGEDVAQLRHDVEMSLANAPTFQLFTELASYDKSIRSGKPQQLVQALSRFDALARTQLERCGVQPQSG